MIGPIPHRGATDLQDGRYEANQRPDHFGQVLYQRGTVISAGIIVSLDRQLRALCEASGDTVMTKEGSGL